MRPMGQFWPVELLDLEHNTPRARELDVVPASLLLSAPYSLATAWCSFQPGGEQRWG